jgi:hypothetical protein
VHLVGCTVGIYTLRFIVSARSVRHTRHRTTWYGRAVTQTVRRRLLTAESLARRAAHVKLRDLYCLPDVVRMIKDARSK